MRPWRAGEPLLLLPYILSRFHIIKRERAGVALPWESPVPVAGLGRRPLAVKQLWPDTAAGGRRKECVAVIDRASRRPSDRELSLSLTSLRRICRGSTLSSLTLLNGRFQLRFARQKPLTNPFKEGSMDFTAPRALSPSFNTVKSKDASTRQGPGQPATAQQFLIPEIPASSAGSPVILTEEPRRSVLVSVAEQIYCHKADDKDPFGH